jgi:PKD repeat protein
MRMRGRFIILGFALFYPILVHSQTAVHGLPESFSVRIKSTKVIADTVLPSLDTAYLLQKDINAGVKNRYGVVSYCNIDIRKEGTISSIQDRGYIWQYKIKSEGAKALGIRFNLYILPPEASVFIYDETHTKLLGAFTQLNNNADAVLTIADIQSDNAIIEYFEPYNSAFSGELQLGAIMQAYKNISYTESSALASSGRISINCPLGNNWQDEKHAICRMTFYDGQDGYYCTGFLVNNTHQDGTPYFMTANHCISTNTMASTLIAYFNYEYTSCSNPTLSETQTISGASLLSTNKYSDFSLLLLKESIPNSYTPYFAGWDASGSISAGSTTIHHPEGTPKCIATDNDATVDFKSRINWDNNSVSAVSTHWEVVFDQGNVEGGSSGGPLFDSNKHVIGQLHGGSDYEEFYGKFSLSWDYSAAASAQLKSWLNPDNSSIKVLDGAYVNIKPRAVFNSNLQKICYKDTVFLTDKSLYNPQQWKWKILPNSYMFVNGTDSASQNPVLVFNADGLYTVALITVNAFGADTMIKADYISRVSDIDVRLQRTTANTTICGCDLNNYKIIATGATDYAFAIDRTDKLSFTTDTSNIYLSIKENERFNGSFETWLKVKGSVGSCKASDSVRLNIVIPGNDYISNAISLQSGANGYFSNQCASKEDGEPMPSFYDCYSNLSWCPGSNEINGSIWFTFLGASNGKVNIRSLGQNTRIAVYSANTNNQIKSGSLSYTLLAANDNVSRTDSSSFIKDLSVDYGRTYWLQVDRDNEQYGDIVIELSSNSINVTPNPSSGEIDLTIATEESGKAEVEIFSPVGRLMYTNNFDVTDVSNRFPLDLSYLSSGLYIMHVKLGGNVMKYRFVIVK